MNSLFRPLHLLRLLCLVVALPALSADFGEIRRGAEQLYAEGSYARAREAYLAADTNALPKAEARWVAFRLADCQWRAAATARSTDGELIQAAKRALEQLCPQDAPLIERDRVWAEANESLGELHARTGDNRDWVRTRYTLALDWWAGQSDLEQARPRYLALIWKWLRGVNQGRYYDGSPGDIPPHLLDNAVTIAKDPNDLARAHYFRAIARANDGQNFDAMLQVEADFQAALKPGRTTDWYDDALYQYATWLSQYGKLVVGEEGRWQRGPDLGRALETYGRLVREFKEGDTRHWREAGQQIDEITGVQLSLSVPGVLLPGSETQFFANWRNLKEVTYTLTPVSLPRDVKFTDAKRSSGEWLQFITPGDAKALRRWSTETGDTGEHLPGSRTFNLTNRLATGAYLLEAKGGGQSARELVLVSDATLVLKTSGKQTLAWFVDALTGKPIPEATVKLWLHYYDGSGDRPRWDSQEKTTDAGGVAVFDFSGRNGDLFASARAGDRQAFAVTGANAWYARPDGWKVYAFTDRPAYRPGETAQWKLTARRYADGSYSTPANLPLHYEITDPRGAKLTNGVVTLNDFGSAWAATALTDQQPLGEYQVQFWEDAKHERHVGGATLFRLEEYKLPEFEVKVLTPEEDAPGGGKRKKSFRLGDQVEIAIQADYYFGGAVADASVEVVVRQAPFNWYWPVPYEFPWLHASAGDGFQPGGGLRRGGFRRPPYGGDQIVKRETLKTDANGRATLTLDSDVNGSDLDFQVEARVTDAARREITANGSVRVTRQRYSVNARPANNLPRPGDKVRVAFTAKDANDQPISVAGTVRITREYWWEIWLDSYGREVKGDALKAAREKSTVWPPKPEPGMKEWRLKSAGYEQEAVATNTVSLDAEGKGELTFTPAREGYYRFAWSSPDAANLRVPALVPRITTEATVWVTTARTTDLGYRTGGLELIVDADTFRVGQTAPVMLVGPGADRWVLFTVEAGGLDSFQVVHLTGTTRLLELPITERHVPNLWLGGALVNDRQLFTDEKEIVVPPTKNFLTVEVKSDRADYQPRDDGSFTVTTRDDQGRPVSAEVALSLVDESVFYIQPDYAGDPRPFFFGEKRGQQIRTDSSFSQRQFIRLVKSRLGDLRDDRQPQPEEEDEVKEDGEVFKKPKSITALPMLSLADAGENAVYARRYDMSLPKRRAAASGPRGEIDKMAAGSALALGVPVQFAGRKLAAGIPASDVAEGEPAVVVRSDFRATAFWQPDVKTGADGTARVAVKYPESLTRWQATARAVTTGSQVGWAKASARTRQPLILRLQTPRFLVVGDLAVVSVVINNNTAEPLTLTPKLAVEGAVITGGFSRGEFIKEERGPVTVPANGEVRVNWAVSAQQAGKAKFTVSGHAGKFADAMERVLPVEEHGIEKFLAKSGKATQGDVTVKLGLPARKPGSERLTVSVTPSLAVTMLDALPYLADYPYGCTEQTLSRFLPATIVRQTLRSLGLDAETAMARTFGGIETNTAAAAQPGGKKDLNQLNAMVAAGLDRLNDFQHADGGWGWWKEGESDAWMTAYVVWGLNLARQADVKVDNERLRRALVWLERHLVEAENDPALQAWMLHALAVQHARVKAASVGEFQAKALANLWNQRDQMNPYTRALFALAAHHFGDHEKALALVRALSDGVVRDDRPDASVLLGNAGAGAPPTVHWGRETGWWSWSDGGVETTAFALRALLAIDPKNELVEPAANWLLKNRRGAQWSNTRDTALVILALNDYLRVTGELKGELDYEVIVNGQSLARKRITPADIVSAPSVFTVDPKLVRDANEIRIVRHGGNAPVYFAVQAALFSAEEPVTPAGNELFVRRSYFKLVPRATLLKGTVFDRVPLNDGETVNSGERIETVLSVEAKNHYEYLLFEDLKPAGFEAVEVRSGGSLYAREVKRSAAPVTSASAGERDEFTGRTRWVYPEWRDRKAALFVDHLPQGIWELRYEFRAETPGRFHALPVVAHAMYVPEIRANSAELRVNVGEGK
jgi:uncharacterized protein YfaS (alpha-2-macroglobulin family)